MKNVDLEFRDFLNDPIKPDEKSIETAEDLINAGLELYNERQLNHREMMNIAKNYEEQTKIEKKKLLQIKDYLHYKGNGWGEDCLEKNKEEKTKHPDKISPAFRKVCEIMSNMHEAGLMDELKDYLDACKDRGVIISFDENFAPNPTKDTTALVRECVKSMSNYQNNICEKDECMDEELAPQAETLNLAPKNKYKTIIQLAAKKKDGKDVDDKIQDEYVKLELYTNGLEKIGEI